MSALAEAKRAFYREERVAGAYDRQRFGGASGAYVNERELRLVAGLLPARARMLADVGTGTGRLLPLLRARADYVLALDASMAMLQQARERPGDPGEPETSFAALKAPALVQADAFSLPLRSGALDAATCLRVLFHFDRPEGLLRELRRAVRPGGILVADTASWSPRGLLPLGRGRWGERVAVVNEVSFRALAQNCGWRVQEERAAFLISPYMYRLLPLRLSRALEQLEPHLPRPLLCRVFWRLEAA